MRLLAGSPLLALLLVGLPAQASGPAAPDRAVTEGRTLYLRYCASCHGVGGAGDGPVRPVLDRAPADLRRLSERYGRPLAADAIARFIDGREAVAAHGDREMPVWGARFHDIPEEGEARESRIRERLRALVAYLQSIQLPPARTPSGQPPSDDPGGGQAPPPGKP